MYYSSFSSIEKTRRVKPTIWTWEHIGRLAVLWADIACKCLPISRRKYWKQWCWDNWKKYGISKTGDFGLWYNRRMNEWVACFQITVGKQFLPPFAWIHWRRRGCCKGGIGNVLKCTDCRKESPISVGEKSVNLIESMRGKGKLWLYRRKIYCDER